MYMSANELEDLMSQLNTDSQNAFNIHDLGITADGRWSYPEEEDYTRHGLERGYYRGHGENRTFEPKPLKKNTDREYSDPKPYIPSFGKFVVDDEPIAKHYKLPTKQVYYEYANREVIHIDTLWNMVREERKSLTIEQVWALFWNEHWEKQALKKKLNNIRNSRNNRRTFGEFVPNTASISVFPPIPQHPSVTNGGPPHANSSHTETGAAKRSRTFAAVADDAKDYPPPAGQTNKPGGKPAALAPQSNAPKTPHSATASRANTPKQHQPATSRQRTAKQQASATPQQPRTPKKTIVNEEDGYQRVVYAAKGGSRD